MFSRLKWSSKKRIEAWSRLDLRDTNDSGRSFQEKED